MTEALRAALRTHFGFDEFRPGQVEAIHSLLADRHTLVVMPTGAGKSLIYQFAALQRPGVTLVISPLIALMKDQVDSLARRGIPATYINSTLPGEEQARRLQAMAEGAFRLVYVAPERLRNTSLQQTLSRVHVSLLAVDEAHCISQWGHDFRPDYLYLDAARMQMGDPVTAALTATATPQVQDDIVRRLGLPAAHRIVTGFNRANLTFEVRYTAGLAAKLQAVRDLLSRLDDGAAIIYVGTRRDAEEVAEFIRTVGGVNAVHYHAGLDDRTRTRVQDAFIARNLPVIVATNAFGMGIDRPDVRLVAHYSMPGTLEAYYQEAGRAGRDGQPAQAVLLYDPQDRALQEWFIENDAPTAQEVRALYQNIASRPARGRSTASEAVVTIEDLSLATGLHEVKVRVGLAQLESAGAIQRLGDDGPRIWLRLGAWDEAALQATTAEMEERRRHRRRQLAHMVAYAETNACRRRILLDHFGDPSPADAPHCCDNHLAQQAASSQPATTDVATLSDAARIGLAILDAVRRLKWGVGREKLAHILKGSRAKDILQLNYNQTTYYGRLAIFSLGEIEGLIGQLIEQGHLKVIGGNRPVLSLTPQGEAALKARAPIPLRLSRIVRPEAIDHKRAKRQAGGTVELTAQMFAQGLTPAQIAAQRELTEGTIYTHLAQLIGKGTLPLSAVVPESVVSLVYTAIAEVGDVVALGPIKARLPDSISYGQIRCVVEAWKREQGETSSQQPYVPDDVADFLARPHPRQLMGPWRAGWALDFHSRFAGANWGQSATGELTYRLKYAGDPSALQPLVEQALAVCARRPELADVDALVPVPPSTPRDFDPVKALADALAARLDKPVWPVVVKTRQTAPQKDMRTLAQKKANVAGAFAVHGDVRGKRLLVVDDLYDSGATLEEISRVLRLAGAARLCVLTLTRTIHRDA